MYSVQAAAARPYRTTKKNLRVMAAEQVETMEDRAQASGDNQKEGKEVDTLLTDLVIKHPLQNKWTLWFFRNTKGKSWEENLYTVTSFDTVEDFWALFNHVEVASRLQQGCDYSLFKHGIKPMWEDERNKLGGRWLLTLAKGQLQNVDDYWLETLLCLIGEAFDEQADEICGAVINIRARGAKIGVWTGDARKEDQIKKIGLKLKERLSIPENCSIHYETHDDTMTKSGSTAKNRFVV